VNSLAKLSALTAVGSSDVLGSMGWQTIIVWAMLNSVAALFTAFWAISVAKTINKQKTIQHKTTPKQAMESCLTNTASCEEKALVQPQNQNADSSAQSKQ
jgi:hypothetical protein